MSKNTSTAETTLGNSLDFGPVRLLVKDLDSMLHFYQHTLGFKVLNHVKGNAMLGVAGSPLLVLDQDHSLARALPGSAGLFHTAFLYASPSDLAAAVAALSMAYPHLYQGSADHLVSEAFYFGDPEGNGVELYTDRPPTQWQWTRGQVVMDSLPLSREQYLAAHWTGGKPSSAAATTVGHVHLQVGDIGAAKRFYADIVGFDITAQMGDQAMFLSIGGYHHHLGVNTWRSAGAGLRTPTLGLAEVNLQLPEADNVDALAERLRAAGIAHGHDGQSLIVDDPWNNRLRLQQAPSDPSVSSSAESY